MSYKEFSAYYKRLNPLMKLLNEAGKRCTPPKPKNWGLSCCSVRDRMFPKSAMANWVRDHPDKIEEFKEAVRLNLLFYCAYHHIIGPEGAEDIKDRTRLNELCEALDEAVSKSLICPKNTVRQWRFIRDKRAVKRLDTFFNPKESMTHDQENPRRSA